MKILCNSQRDITVSFICLKRYHHYDLLVKRPENEASKGLLNKGLLSSHTRTNSLMSTEDLVPVQELKTPEFQLAEAIKRAEQRSELQQARDQMADLAEANNFDVW